MMTFVKGADLPRVDSECLPVFRTAIHYVYPNACYQYTACYEQILVDNEVALIARCSIRKLNPDLYPVDAAYFIFRKTINFNIREQIYDGRATSLTKQEAERMHIYLLDLGMICVSPAVRDGTLFKRLIEQMKRLSQEKTMEDYLRDALPERREGKANIYPSFLYEKEEASLTEQLAHIDARHRTSAKSVKVGDRKRSRTTADRYVTDKRARHH